MTREVLARQARARLESLLGAARRIANKADSLGQAARDALRESTGLSRAGVELALTRCLETEPSETELAALIASTPRSARAHILLSSNVFVAAHRAIAIGLASSAEVRVRASRREPSLPKFLLAGAPGAFTLTSELEPRAGDHVWAYGSDATLADFGGRLEPEVVLHAHGSGFGVAVVCPNLEQFDAAAQARALAFDTVLFDQRGCLSPRLALVVGTTDAVRSFARALADALTALEAAVPRGRLSAEEAADITRFRDSAGYAGELLPAGKGFVSLATLETWSVAPIGRNITVVPVNDPVHALEPWRAHLTALGIAGDGAMRAAIERAFPDARTSALGAMQTPAFDGPVDRRRHRSQP